MDRHITVELINRHAAYVRGYGSFDALVAVTGGNPVRSTIARAWVVSERTALQRLLPYLENLGYSVVVTGPRATAALADISTGANAPVEPPPPADEDEEALW